MKVYLSGGMKTEWRNQVKKEVPELKYIDPAEKEKNKVWTLEEYGTWDLHFIKHCDIVFSYMAKDNPSGIGLSCENGYAFGIGKTIILVLEKEHEIIKDRYLSWLKKVAHITFDSLDEGINYLKTFQQQL